MQLCKWVDCLLEGDRITRFDAAQPEVRDAEAIVERYPVGEPVPVYYDPERPESAGLDNAVSATSYSPLGLGAVLLVAAAGMRLWAARP